MRFCTVVILCLLFGTLNVVNAGGPWAAGQKSGYAEVGYSFNVGGWTTENTLQLYLEAGLWKNLSFKGIFPLKFVGTHKDETNKFTPLQTGRLTGVGNQVLGLHYQFLNKGVAMGAGLDVGFRTFKSNQELGLRTGFDSWQFKPNISIGRGSDRGYFYVSAIPSFSTNNYSADINLVFDGGTEAAEEVWLGLFASYVYSFENGTFNATDHGNYRHAGFYIDQQSYLTIGPKLSARLYEGFGLSLAGLYSVGMVGAGNTFSLKAGFYYKWKPSNSEQVPDAQQDEL